MVGLPLAARFQKTEAIDLKFYSAINGRIIPCNQAVCRSTYSSKHLKVIVNAILSHWINVYEAARKFLSDNRGEFINKEFLVLGEQFNVIVQMATVDSTSSIGLVERHNLALAEMPDQVLADFQCSFSILPWLSSGASMPGIRSTMLSVLPAGSRSKPKAPGPTYK